MCPLATLVPIPRSRATTPVPHPGECWGQIKLRARTEMVAYTVALAKPRYLISLRRAGQTRRLPRSLDWPCLPFGRTSTASIKTTECAIASRQ